MIGCKKGCSTKAYRSKPVFFFSENQFVATHFCGAD